MILLILTDVENKLIKHVNGQTRAYYYNIIFEPEICKLSEKGGKKNIKRKQIHIQKNQIF